VNIHSSRVVDWHLDDIKDLPEHKLAIFYSSRKGPGSDRQKALEIIDTLISQLAWSTDRTAVAVPVRIAYEDSKGSLDRRPNNEEWLRIFCRTY